MIQQKLSLFQTLTSVPSRAVGFDEIVRLILHDSDVANKTMTYRKTKEALGKRKADEEVKQRMMPAFSVGVLFDGNGRKPTNILGFTGLALCDIDHIGDKDGGGAAGQALEEAFRKAKADPHTLMAYRTMGGQGLRVIYRYAREAGGSGAGSSQYLPLDATSWPAAFLKGNRHYARLTGHDYDPQCAPYGQLSGLAHDGGAYVNPQAEPFVITDDEILAANFSAEHEKGKQRREYPADTHTTGIDEAWPKVEQTLKRRGLTYQSGHHHDYVMHAAFLMNRYGADLDELLARAAQEWSDYNPKEREATIRSCFRHTQEHGTWRLNLQGRKSKETSMITLPEIGQWLSHHVEVIYNVVTDQAMYRVKEETAGLSPLKSLDDRVICSLRSQMAADTGKRVLKSDVVDVLHSDFARLVHPVRDYIDSLPQWDGTDHVRQLSQCLTAEPVQAAQTQEEAQELLHWALHKWLVAAVATWQSDSASNHGIFVLIGAQGIYKTTFFRHLLPPPLRQYFWENAHNSFASKDDHLALAENCLVEIEEIDLQNPRDISELKALATSQTVKERRPYARFREEKHRLASFCGSGNQQRFLSDDTGNRRWLCFKVSHISDPRQWAFDHDQLYAQLRDELRQGFQYWFDPRDQQRVEQQNQCFRIESDEEQLIRTRLRPPRSGDKITLMNAASVCQYINGGIVGRGLSTRKVGLAMRKLGFEKIHTRQGEFYECYQIPPNEIQPTLAMTDGETSDTQPDTACVEQPLPF